MPLFRGFAATAALLLAAFALAGCARPLVRDPVVVRLVEALVAGEKVLESSGDEITAPRALVELIGLGAAAVPTLLDLLPSLADEWTVSLVLEAIGRSGDLRSREPVEHLLTSPSPHIAEGALNAIERLGQPQSIPVLRGLLGRPDRGGFGLGRLLGALLRVGAETELEPLIALGLANEKERYQAVQALLHHDPLRMALGMREVPQFVFDEDLFLRAAQEWAMERRGAQSPWRAAPDFVFSAPFAAEKQQAFAILQKSANVWFETVRCLPVDVSIADEASRDPIVVLSGWGHGQGIALDVWQPRSQTVRLHRFSICYGTKRTTFAGDVMEPRYEVAELPIVAWERTAAGVRAALAARIVPWWNGPDMRSFVTSNNFGIVLLGVTTPEVMPAFCGYEDSTNAPLYAPLAAARDWHLRVAREAPCQLATPDEEARALFTEHWLRSYPRWDHDDQWSFVRERMVAMAGAFGTAALVPNLRAYLEPRYAGAASSEARTAAHACTALAALTAIELRFDAKGTPRATADAAKDYRERLDRK